LFLGQTDTSVVIQASSGQGSNLLRVIDNSATVTYFLIGPSGNISSASSVISLTGIPTYADNATAVAAGLAAGRIYKTATGEIRIVV
jgi:hypothetical protein